MRTTMHAIRRAVVALSAAIFIGIVLAGTTGLCAAPPVPLAARIAAYRADRPVEPLSDSTLLVEAEEFTPSSGWQPRPWGDNYYAATLANTFLSRKAYLGAEPGADASASITVRIPRPGRYLALIRYEAAPKFETQFRLRIEQGGQVRLSRLYGARENVKIWAFGERLKKEATWSWGAVENIVWEGHDAAVDLAAGEARLTLLAGPQPSPAARRNVDAILLTTDEAGVRERIARENYLPLDGLLTQFGDVYLRLRNDSAGRPLTLTINPGIEHSPYWVHRRDWKEKKLIAQPGQLTEWLEVGSLLDTLNDGQWRFAAAGEKPLRYAIEFALKDAAGQLIPLRTFSDLGGDVEIAYHADTRYSRQIGATDELLYNLVDWLKAHPVPGAPPRRTLIYGYTFQRKPKDPRYNAALDEFQRLIGATALIRNTDDDADDRAGLLRGYIDLRDKTPAQLEEACQKLKAAGTADRIAVVSLGDEIGLKWPEGDVDTGFRAWLRAQNLKPTDVDPAAGEDWNAIRFKAGGDAATANPRLFYHSNRYRWHYGIAAQKQLTDALRRHLPNAGIGANFSPHHGRLYLGGVHQWVTLFREGGMTMPWSEDYVWQPPIGSQQMNFLSVDLFRSGVRDRPDAKIHMYVMPHWPGNTPESWRRQFYGVLGHGARIVNLFEFRPVQAAYTENHVSLPEMYQAVRAALHELGQFEDFIQDGRPRAGLAALWCGETADIWDDNAHPFDAAKRTLYIAVRQQQLPLDIVIEADALADRLKGYRVIYLADRHVSEAASRALSAWVAAGGRLIATAGAGMFNEYNQPNAVLRELTGASVDSVHIAANPVRREKEDLPFVEPIDTVRWSDGGREWRIPVIDVRARVTPAPGTAITGRFGDNAPAVLTRSVGQGSVVSFAFLPGLSYFKPALPQRPADRGTRNESMAHFIPTAFDPGATRLFGATAASLPIPVTASDPLVETTLIDSPHGTLLTLVNWSAGPQQRLRLRLDQPLGNVRLSTATGVPITLSDDRQTLTLDLDIADAVMIRPISAK